MGSAAAPFSASEALAGSRRARLRIAISLGVALIVAVGLGWLFPVGGHGAGQGCFPAGATTMAKSRDGRVYYTREGRVFGCLYGVGKPLLLEDIEPSNPTPYMVQMDSAGMAGRFAAVSDRVCEGPVCFSGIVIWDLKRRRPFRRAGTGGHQDEYSQSQDDEVPVILLKKNGSVAWTTGEEPEGRTRFVATVHRLDGRGARKLDEGRGIDVRSLRFLRGRDRIAWTTGGRTRSASLR